MAGVLARVLLRARAEGVWSLNLNQQIWRSPNSGATLADGIRMSCHPQLLFGMGYGLEPWRKPRRPVEEISPREG
jgi:hypothetical protein